MRQICRVCSAEQPIDRFYVNWSKAGNAYRRSECIDCANKRRKLSYMRDPRRGILQNTKQRARKEGIPFILNIEDIIIPERCPVLGAVLRRGTSKDYDASPTIDRLKPELGYVKGNVKVISMMANRMKSNATERQIELFCENILKYLKNEKPN